MDDGIPALQADERKLKQILINLLSNAIKFTEQGGDVSVKAWVGSDQGLIVEITDTGIGMAPEDIPKALRRFSQVDSGIDRKFQGTGLGLTLTQSLVDMHEGSLELQSEVGVGTIVTVRFPAYRLIPDVTMVGQQAG